MRSAIVGVAVLGCFLVLAGKAGQAVAKDNKAKARKGASLEWVSITGGTFRVPGNSKKVMVASFSINMTEVTVEQYAVCVRAKKCKKPPRGLTQGISKRLCRDPRKPAPGWGRCNWSKHGRGSHPINCVNWRQARKFCKWAGGRLPSEAEWEFAARSGKQQKYPWGSEVPTCSHMVKHKCGTLGTQPVCSKPAGNTPHGLCDMAGNVWEWVEDSYTGPPVGLAPTPRANRPGRSGGFVYQYARAKVVLGSSWQWRGDDDLGRWGRHYTCMDWGLGFRCVK